MACLCVCVCVCVCVHACMHVCVRVHACMHVCVCVWCVCVYVNQPGGIQVVLLIFHVDIVEYTKRCPDNINMKL